jgi:hypothetical protein
MAMEQISKQNIRRAEGPRKGPHEFSEGLVYAKGRALTVLIRN